ncbi:MAG: MOSC domain-containing protein [Gammaproteobacteria bacterium]
MLIESLHIYPIKSVAGIALERSTVENRGLAHDRRFLLIDDNGQFITGRQQPDLVLVSAQSRDDGWQIDAPQMSPLRLTPPPVDAPTVALRIWRDDVSGTPVSREADEWFSDYLGASCRLVFQHATAQRLVQPAHGTQPTDVVSYADGYPVLLIGSASLNDLNRRLKMPVAMSRFRTNLVAATDEAFAEDRWRRIRIGEIEFDVVKRCARCVFTTVDPLSGQRDAAGEPLATLRSYRLDKQERGVMFGVNLVPRGDGTIEAGAPIEVLSSD